MPGSHAVVAATPSSVLRIEIILRDLSAQKALKYSSMPRKYAPHEQKHKWPKGYGSLCPSMPAEVPTALLRRAIAVPGVGTNKLWMASGRWCFCAHPSPNVGPDAWHGFPVIGGDVDERVLAALYHAGHITRRELKRLRTQRQLPEAWP